MLAKEKASAIVALHPIGGTVNFCNSNLSRLLRVINAIPRQNIDAIVDARIGKVIVEMVFKDDIPVQNHEMRFVWVTDRFIQNLSDVCRRLEPQIKNSEEPVY